MKIAISGGGTAGHIYPAIAVGNELKKNDGVELIYLGLKDSLEKKLSLDEGYKFYEIESAPFSKRPSFKTVKSYLKIVRGILQAKKILKKEKVEAVFITGGFITGPVAIAAKLLNIPYYIHESNAFPGITTRFLAKSCETLFYSYPETINRIKNYKKVSFSGTPIRENFLKNVKSDRKKINEKPKIVSFGGSGGQKSLNEVVLELLKSREITEYEWIHSCGLNWEEEFRDYLGEKNNFNVQTYFFDLYDHIFNADVVICGCGAQTLTEISALKKAAILIPKSYVINNHQYFNAKVYVDNNAASMLTEENLTKESLLKEIEHILKDSVYKENLENNIYKFFKKDASRLIANSIMDDIYEKNSRRKEKN